MDNATARKRPLLRFAINLALLPTGLAMMVSGFATHIGHHMRHHEHIGYHMRHHGHIDVGRVFWGMDFQAWSATHKTSIVVGSLLTLVHLLLHWRWLRAVVDKRLFAKNRLVVTLTTLFVAAAITGYTPWFVDLLGGSATARKALIEIHDKLALVLSVCLAIHVLRRIRWFFLNAGPSLLGRRPDRGIPSADQ